MLRSYTVEKREKLCHCRAVRYHQCSSVSGLERTGSPTAGQVQGEHWDYLMLMNTDVPGTVIKGRAEITKQAAGRNTKRRRKQSVWGDSCAGRKG